MGIRLSRVNAPMDGETRGTTHSSQQHWQGCLLHPSATDKLRCHISTHISQSRNMTKHSCLDSSAHWPATQTCGLWSERLTLRACHQGSLLVQRLTKPSSETLLSSFIFLPLIFAVSRIVTQYAASCATCVATASVS